MLRARLKMRPKTRKRTTPEQDASPKRSALPRIPRSSFATGSVLFNNVQRMVPAMVNHSPLSYFISEDDKDIFTKHFQVQHPALLICIAATDGPCKCIAVGGQLQEG